MTATYTPLYFFDEKSFLATNTVIRHEMLAALFGCGVDCWFVISLGCIYSRNVAKKRIKVLVCLAVGRVFLVVGSFCLG